jgi:hypothetical protein
VLAGLQREPGGRGSGWGVRGDARPQSRFPEARSDRQRRHGGYPKARPRGGLRRASINASDTGRVIRRQAGYRAAGYFHSQTLD